jgi:hypothetical protein
MTADVLEWSWNPWRDRPGRAALASTTALLVCGLVMVSRLPAFMTLAMCGVVLASLAVAFVPVRCRLDGEGATRRSGWMVERRRWGDLERAVRTSEGFLLSPFRERHWLDAYRALFLPIPVRGTGPTSPDVTRFLERHGL